MKLFNPNSHSAFVNLVADSILMRLNSKGIIVVTLSDNLVIINGITQTHNFLNSSIIENIVSSCSYDIFGRNKELSVIETIKYNQDIPEDYNLKEIDVYNTLRPIYDLDSPFVNENKLQYTSDFPYGYCLEMGRLMLYYSEMIFKNVRNSIGLQHGKFSVTNRNIRFEGKSYLTDAQVESLILDYFDFNLTDFKNHINGYDLTRDIKYPLEMKPWLKDELMMKIEVF